MANPLSEQERLKILELVGKYGTKWKFISTFLPGRTEPTIKSFYNSYQKNGTIFPKRGRPIQITQEKRDGIIKSIKEDPEQHLTDLSFEFEISAPSCKMILNKAGFKFQRKIAVAALKKQHIKARLEMADRFLFYNYRDLWPIIFTDESTIVVNLNNGGVWRLRGHHPPQSFYIK